MGHQLRGHSDGKQLLELGHTGQVGGEAGRLHVDHLLHQLLPQSWARLLLRLTERRRSEQRRWHDDRGGAGCKWAPTGHAAAACRPMVQVPTLPAAAASTATTATRLSQPLGPPMDGGMEEVGPLHVCSAYCEGIVLA